MITPELPDLIYTPAELFSLKQIMTWVKENSWNWYNLSQVQLHPDGASQHSEKMVAGSGASLTEQQNSGSAEI